ncbi:Nn.00g073670.m01.CDS01 [Neocucurbitaria sp. VM-36]
MTTQRAIEGVKIYPPVELLKCPYATESPSPDNYGAVVTVHVGVGEGKRTFHVYEGLLKHYSGYFRAALGDHWVEGQLRTIQLYDDNNEVFRTFFHWISTGKLYSKLTSEGKIPHQFHQICQLYVFGDAREIPELCNAAVDLMFQKLCQDLVFPYTELNYIYSNTCDGSALRKLLVTVGVENFSWEGLRQHSRSYPKEFLLDVMELLRDRQTPLGGPGMGIGKWNHTRKLKICSEYHDHKTSGTQPS